MLTLTLHTPDSNRSISTTDIISFEMSSEKNRHTTVTINAILPEDIGRNGISPDLENSVLNISEIINEETTLVFCGLATMVLLQQEGEEYIINIEGASFTKLLDIRKKCKSFQNTDMSFAQLFKQVLADTESADMIFCQSDSKLEKPVYQYEETDWEFLVRIASQLKTSLVSVAAAPNPQLYFGLPPGTKHYNEHYQVEKIWFNKAFYQLNCELQTTARQHFFCHDLISMDRWQMGDWITLQNGQKKQVTAIYCRLEKGMLIYHYTLAVPETFCIPAYGKRQLAGVSLIGTVLETRQESVRVWLEIDKEPSDNSWWYDWVPETGNMMYCMPEIGERVLITFDDEFGNARATGLIRHNSAGHPELQDEANRYFTTAQNKRLYALPEALGIIGLNQNIPLKIELNDASGTSIESNQGVTILAKGEIYLEAKQVSFFAPQEISLLKRAASEPTVLNMCNGFDCVGKYTAVNMAGTSYQSFPLVNASIEETYDISGMEMEIVSSTPQKAGTTQLEKQIFGTQVHQLQGQNDKRG